MGQNMIFARALRYATLPPLASFKVLHSSCSFHAVSGAKVLHGNLLQVRCCMCFNGATLRLLNAHNTMCTGVRHSQRHRHSVKIKNGEQFNVNITQ